MAVTRRVSAGRGSVRGLKSEGRTPSTEPAATCTTEASVHGPGRCIASCAGGSYALAARDSDEDPLPFHVAYGDSAATILAKLGSSTESPSDGLIDVSVSGSSPAPRGIREVAAKPEATRSTSSSA